jgi:hypothetical protein
MTNICMASKVLPIGNISLHTITPWPFEAKVLRTLEAKVRSFGTFHTMPPLNHFHTPIRWYGVHLNSHYPAPFVEPYV